MKLRMRLHTLQVFGVTPVEKRIDHPGTESDPVSGKGELRM